MGSQCHVSAVNFPAGSRHTVQKRVPRPRTRRSRGVVAGSAPPLCERGTGGASVVDSGNNNFQGK